MALRNIRENGDAVLLKKSRKVNDFNERLHILLDDMRETLFDANGVGLAAPQVGILRRVVLVLETNKDCAPDDQVIELINPEIIEQSGEQTGPEGCLSVPDLYGIVTRPDHVKVRAQDRFGNVFEAEGDGLTARAFCHEIDHLDGHLFTELADRLLTPEELDELSESEETGETNEAPKEE